LTRPHSSIRRLAGWLDDDSSGEEKDTTMTHTSTNARILAAACVSIALIVALVTPPATRAADDAATTPASKPAKVQPVDFRKLKEWLPGELSSLKRSSAEGEKVGIGEMLFTVARGDYGKSEEENAPTVHVEVSDYGATPDMAKIATAWSSVEIDKESDDGYERTLKVADKYPAYETYQKAAKSGSVQVFVADRFIVNVTTQNVSEEDFKKIAAALPLDKLAELK
jgi:hypothetical protein